MNDNDPSGDCPQPAAGLSVEQLAALEARDVPGLLRDAGGQALELVAGNVDALLKRGLYEVALLTAYRARGAAILRNEKTRWFHPREIERLFFRADAGRLRAAGDPLPGAGPYICFRGVGGLGGRREIKGLPWTLSPELAACCAVRACRLHRNLQLTGAPEVYRIVVGAEAILAYLHNPEYEALVRVPADVAPVLVLEGDRAIVAAAGWAAQQQRSAGGDLEAALKEFRDAQKALRAAVDDLR